MVKNLFWYMHRVFIYMHLVRTVILMLRTDTTISFIFISKIKALYDHVPEDAALVFPVG